jgi:formyltetrahydrofolate-dependent phosphoribosylglycinamide formyltransferase
MRIAVLISGRGSNMLQLAAHADPASGFEIVLVAANKSCDGLALAETRGLSTQLISRADFASRQDQEAALGDAIIEAGAEIICLAGYMAILSPAFVERFAGCIINIHPSLLPDLKGLDTHERAIAVGMARHGASVHLVTAELDDGPMLLQAGLDVMKGEDAGSLAARVLCLEHALYPFVVSSLANGRLTAGPDGVIWHDGATALKSAEPAIADVLEGTVIWPAAAVHGENSN